jgi:hypothetical protein
MQTGCNASHLMQLGSCLRIGLQHLNAVLSSLNVCGQLVGAGITVSLQLAETVSGLEQLRFLLPRMRFKVFELLLELSTLLVQLEEQGILVA